MYSTLKNLDKSKKWTEIIEYGAKDLGVILNSKQLDCMAFHKDELIKWNKKFNITSITDPYEIAIKHFIDCLAIIPHIPKNKKVLDIGSGGGFPGLPLKIANPSIDLTLVDASRKKVSFLNYIIRSLNMSGAKAIHARCEELADNKEFKHKFDCVLSRAFTSLDRFISLSTPFLSKNGFILAMKGKNYNKELQLIAKKNLDVKIYDYNLSNEKYKRSVIKISL